jgi:hypothetical protein
VRTLGIATGYPPRNSGRPAVSCVLLEGARDSPTVVDSFDLRTPADEPMDQLQDLARALSSKLSSLDVDAVVIRVADRSPRANQSVAPRRRLLIEGAIALCCRDKTNDVRARSGLELGRDIGMSKADLIALAQTIDAARPDAAAAAVTVLPK